MTSMAVAIERELARFTEFFLKTCLDQVGFMEGLIEPEALRNRILLWSDEESRGIGCRQEPAQCWKRSCFVASCQGEMSNDCWHSDRTARRQHRNSSSVAS